MKEISSDLARLIRAELKDAHVKNTKNKIYVEDSKKVREFLKKLEMGESN